MGLNGMLYKLKGHGFNLDIIGIGKIEELKRNKVTPFKGIYDPWSFEEKLLEITQSNLEAEQRLEDLEQTLKGHQPPVFYPSLEEFLVDNKFSGMGPEKAKDALSLLARIPGWENSNEISKLTKDMQLTDYPQWMIYDRMESVTNTKDAIGMLVQQDYFKWQLIDDTGVIKEDLKELTRKINSSLIKKILGKGTARKDDTSVEDGLAYGIVVLTLNIGEEEKDEELLQMFKHTFNEKTLSRFFEIVLR